MAPNNPLPIHGNEKTMNLNHLILTNIQSSPYFKVNLYELKTYHEVIDEIYYKVSHLEPWEKGSRKTAGQTGMCGGVRGVGAGGIVSSAFCLLYKLFTLRLTRKQLMGLCTHTDSPYIRGLGFMYIRYTQNPADFWDWFEEYLADEEEIDVKAGGGHNIKIGDMLRQWLTKLEWYSTLFPRIPVPVQKSIEQKLKQYDLEHIPLAPVAPITDTPVEEKGPDRGPDRGVERGADRGADRGIDRERGGYGDGHHSRDSESRHRRATPPFNIAKEFEKSSSSQHGRSRSPRPSPPPRHRHRSRSPRADPRHRSHRSHSRDRSHRGAKDKRRDKERKRDRRSRSRESDRHRHKHRDRRETSRDRRESSRDRWESSRDRRETSFERDLRKEKSRHKRRDD